MQLSEFDYTLPEELIARYPLEERDKSRLLVVNSKKNTVQHSQFSQLIDYLEPGDCLVLNNTKVMQARLHATKLTGGKVEILVERVLSDSSVLAHVGSNKRMKPGTTLIVNEVAVQVLEKQENLFLLQLSDGKLSWLELMQAQGQLPLPPYLQRNVESDDTTRYQTVYANELGAVAAPTAGLHFNDNLLQTLNEKGISCVFITLHVGAGTFQPVRVNDLSQHVMHQEQVIISQAACNTINKAKQQGKRVVAVGTTSLRALESAALNASNYSITKTLEPYAKDTGLFITPGFKFQVVDALITNFHLPKSTLLMLVSALMGHSLMQQAYETAIQSKYRFFSYGDAMFIHSAESGEYVQ